MLPKLMRITSMRSTTRLPQLWFKPNHQRTSFLKQSKHQSQLLATSEKSNHSAKLIKTKRLVNSWSNLPWLFMEVANKPTTTKTLRFNLLLPRPTLGKTTLWSIRFYLRSILIGKTTMLLLTLLETSELKVKEWLKLIRSPQKVLKELPCLAHSHQERMNKDNSSTLLKYK
jgi:hypothetical protein